MIFAVFDQSPLTVCINCSFFYIYTLIVAPMAVKFGTEEGTFGALLRAKFHPHRCNVSPLRGEKPQNRPLSKVNNRRFALRAMLPVNGYIATSVT